MYDDFYTAITSRRRHQLITTPSDLDNDTAATLNLFVEKGMT